MKTLNNFDEINRKNLDTTNIKEILAAELTEDRTKLACRNSENKLVMISLPFNIKDIEHHIKMSEDHVEICANRI